MERGSGLDCRAKSYVDLDRDEFVEAIEVLTSQRSACVRSRLQKVPALARMPD